MSCDFGVWFPHRRLSSAEASEVYGQLCAGDASVAPPHPAVDAFYRELTARYPEIDDVPDDRIDDHDYCPWSGSLDRSPGHVILSCVWSKAEEVARVVQELAGQHGLVVYDPQAERLLEPAASPAPGSPWKFRSENREDVPLPPAGSFAQALQALNREHNSYYILEHEKGNYMQCGGGQDACSVEMRIYGPGGSYQHFVIGRRSGADTPVEIAMSAGVIKVQAREVLKPGDAAALFQRFFAREPLPEEFACREVKM